MNDEAREVLEERRSRAAKALAAVEEVEAWVLGSPQTRVNADAGDTEDIIIELRHQLEDSRRRVAALESEIGRMWKSRKRMEALTKTLTADLKEMTARSKRQSQWLQVLESTDTAHPTPLGEQRILTLREFSDELSHLRERVATLEAGR